MSKSDLFIPLGPRHFGVIEFTVESIFKYIPQFINRLCIVSGDVPQPLQARLISMGASFLNEREIFNLTAADFPPALKTNNGTGPLFAQMLKWELRRFSTTPSYFVIDADTILLEPIELEQNSLPVRFRHNRYRFPHIMCFNWCFGLIPAAITPFASDIVSLDVNILEEMTQKIQGRFKMPWHRALLGILQQVKGTHFSFSEIYGYYAALNHPESFVSQTLRTRQLPLKKFYNHPAQVHQSQTGGAAILCYTSTEAPPPAQPVIRMATLGHNGRFGNQIFQYAFLRLYAKRNQLQVECPPWIGNNLFGHKDPLSDRLLPIYREDKAETEAAIRFDSSSAMRDFEVWGYFQDIKLWAGQQEFFRSLFQPLPYIQKALDQAVARILQGDRTLVCIHLRRGDFKFLVGPNFWMAPESWYVRWLETIWLTLDNPILYVATDDPKNVLPHFEKYQPITEKNLGINLTGAEFYVDFHIISQSDVMGISNSTFSFAAAMLNRRAKIFARPDPIAQQMVSFDPWQSPMLLELDPVTADAKAA